MHLQNVLLSLTTLSTLLVQAAPQPPPARLQRRAYFNDVLSRLSSFRQAFAWAPNCFTADGKLCEFPDCYLGASLEDTLFIDCKAISLCVYEKWEGDGCAADHPRDNSAEVCQQNDDEVIDTIAAKTGFTRAVAEEKFRKMLEDTAKGLTIDEICPNGYSTDKNWSKPAAGNSTDTTTPAPKPEPEVTKPVEKVEEKSTTTVKVKSTSTVTVSPSENATSTTTTATGTVTAEPTETPDKKTPKKTPPKKNRICYWNAGCAGLDPEF